MNTPVSFPIAKLLKEKGFDLMGNNWYTNDGVFHETWSNYKNSTLHPVSYLASTISEIVMWLYEKHGIWIYVDFYNKNRWFGVFRNKEGVKTELFDVFNSPTEAYEAAIEYTLNNLV